MPNQLTRTDWGALLLLSVIWGSSFILVDFAVEGLPPVTVVALRVVLASTVLLAVLRWRGQRLPTDAAAIQAYIIGGTLGVSAPFVLIAWGQTHIPGGLAAILNAMVPIWGAVIAHFATKDERLSLRRGLGVLIGFFGVLVVIGPGALGAAGLGSTALVLGQAAVVLAALGYAAGSVYSKRFSHMGIGPLPTSIGNLLVASVTLVPIALVLDRPWTVVASDALWISLACVVALALVSTSVAFILFFRVLASAGATNTQLVTYLIPVSAVLVGAAVRNEWVDLSDVYGMAIIATGLAVVDGRVFTRVSAMR